MQDAVVRSSTQLLYTLELDGRSITELERAVSFAVEYGDRPDPRLKQILALLKDLVRAMSNAAPFLVELQIDADHPRLLPVDEVLELEPPHEEEELDEQE